MLPSAQTKFHMKNEKLKTTPYDSADYLLNRADVLAYLAAAKEDGNPDLIKHAMNTINRAESLRESKNISRHAAKNEKSK
jgi:DNA-binding phage protein